MKNTFWLCLALFLLLALGGCNSGGSVQARPGEEFTLRPGETAALSGEKLTIKFVEVIEDSRCPRNVTCVWAGRVTCIVEMNGDGSPYRMALTEPGLTGDFGKESYQSYKIAFHVEPYPEAGKKIAAEDYRLRMVITK